MLKYLIYKILCVFSLYLSRMTNNILKQLFPNKEVLNLGLAKCKTSWNQIKSILSTI